MGEGWRVEKRRICSGCLRAMLDLSEPSAVFASMLACVLDE
jgi:hypothetical protein